MNVAIFRLIDAVLAILTWLVIIDIVGSWLTVARVRLPNLLYEILVAVHRIVEPILAPIRRVVPSFGGLDISPIIFFLVLNYIVRPLLARILLGF